MKSVALKGIGSGLEFLAKKFVKSPIATDMLNSVSPMTKFAMEEALPIDKQIGQQMESALSSGDWKQWRTISDGIVENAKKNQIANQSSNTLHPTNLNFEQRFIAQRNAQRSNLDPQKLIKEGYNPPDLNKLDEWQTNELAHWSQKGRGTGNYFILEHATDPSKNKRIRLDSKRKFTEDGLENVQSRQFSYKDVDVKASENKFQQETRAPLLRGTTTGGEEVIRNITKNKPQGTIHHHAIPVQSTGKIWVAFEKYLNPNWKLSKNSRPSKQWLELLERAEKEFGVKFGDDPMNARYPKENWIHDLYHDKLRQHGIDPPQITGALKDSGAAPMTQTEAYRYLRKFAEAMKAIDQEMLLLNIL